MIPPSYLQKSSTKLKVYTHLMWFAQLDELLMLGWPSNHKDQPVFKGCFCATSAICGDFRRTELTIVQVGQVLLGALSINKLKKRLSRDGKRRNIKRVGIDAFSWGICASIKSIEARCMRNELNNNWACSTRRVLENDSFAESRGEWLKIDVDPIPVWIEGLPNLGCQNIEKLMARLEPSKKVVPTQSSFGLALPLHQNDYLPRCCYWCVTGIGQAERQGSPQADQEDLWRDTNPTTMFRHEMKATRSSLTRSPPSSLTTSSTRLRPRCVEGENCKRRGFFFAIKNGGVLWCNACNSEEKKVRKV